MHGDGKSFACISLWLFSSRVVLDICLCWARLHAGQPIRFRSFSHDVPFNPISGSTVWFSCFTLFSISFSYVVCYCGNFQYICSSRLCVSVCAVWFESNVQRKKASVILFPFLGSFFPSSATTCVAHFSFCLSLFLELLSTWESRFIYALHVVRNDAKMHSSQEIPMFAAQCAHSTHSLTVVHFILCTLHTVRIMLTIYMYANCHFANHSILHVCLCFKSTKICSTSILRFSNFKQQQQQQKNAIDLTVCSICIFTRSLCISLRSSSICSQHENFSIDESQWNPNLFASMQFFR